MGQYKSLLTLSPAGKAYSLNFKGPPLLWQHQKGSAKIRRLRTTGLVQTNLLQLFMHPQHSEWFSTLSVSILKSDFFQIRHSCYRQIRH